MDEDIDICCITETWLGPGDQDSLITSRLTPTGYSGGGIAAVYTSALKVMCQPVDKFCEFELMEALVNTGNDCVRLCVVYRTKSSPPAVFMEEFAHYIDAHTTTTGQLIIVGDFNLHYDSSHNLCARKLSELLFFLNLHQSMTKAIHWA